MAAASSAPDGSLTLQAAGASVQLGPCLAEGMGESSLVACMNAWGIARDREVLELKSDVGIAMLDLKANLGLTQVEVAAAFEQAKEVLNHIIVVARQQGQAVIARS